MANGIEIGLSVEEKQAIRAIGKVIKAVDKLGDEGTETGKQLDGAFASFAGNLGAMAASKAFDGIISGINGAVSAAKDLEVFETQFKTMLGSTAAAQKQLSDLQEFAASTPFQLPGLASSTRQLLSFGVEQENIIPTLKTLGDIASGVGAQIDDLTIPFGRLQASQKLSLVELDKFADRGVNIYKELSEQTGVSMANIRDDISKGKIPFDEFNVALENLTSEGGTFFNGMEAQSQTLAGVLSTLGDNFFNLEGSIGKAFAPALKTSAGELTIIIGNLAKVFQENGPQIAKVTSTLSDIFFTTPAKFWVDFFGDSTAGENLSDVTGEMKNISDEIDSITDRMTEHKDSTLYNSFFGRKSQDLDDLTEAFEALEKLRLKKVELTKIENAKLAVDVDSDMEFMDDMFADFDTDPQTDPRVIKETAVVAEIQAIRNEQALLASENELIAKEEKGIATESELEELRLFEQQKIELKRQSELAKAEFITEEKKKTDAINKINAKTDLELLKFNGKAEIDLIKKQNKEKEEEEKKAKDKEIEQKKSFMDAATSLANSENKTLAAIGKTAGIVQIAQKTPVAVANSFAFGASIGGPILGAVFGGIALTAMLAQASQMAGVKGFANGGVIGGFQGATGGGDNSIATVRTGEMVLSANEQRNLFDGLQTGNIGTSTNNDEIVSQLLSQPIILKIDNKEIASANRTAIEEGFVA